MELCTQSRCLKQCSHSQRIKYWSKGRSFTAPLHKGTFGFTINAFSKHESNGFADEPCGSKVWRRKVNEWTNKAQPIKCRHFGKHCLHVSNFSLNIAKFPSHHGLVVAHLGLHQNASLIKMSKHLRSITDVFFRFQSLHLKTSYCADDGHDENKPHTVLSSNSSFSQTFPTY